MILLIWKWEENDKKEGARKWRFLFNYLMNQLFNIIWWWKVEGEREREKKSFFFFKERGNKTKEG